MWTVWRLCGICLDRRGAEAIVWLIEDGYDRSVMSIFFHRKLRQCKPFRENAEHFLMIQDCP